MPLPMYQKKAPLTIAVASGKGGVGKSTVSVNLAIAFKKAGMKVGLLDADLYGPSIRRMLPEDRMPLQEGDRITPALSRGIRMLSMAYFRKEHEAAIVRAPIANGVISQFLNQVEWGELDIMIIDFPPGTGDIQLTLSQQANLNGAILVTTPQEVAAMDVRKSAHLFHQVNVPVVGIVENMSYYGPDRLPIFGAGAGERLAAELGVPLLDKLPVDPEWSERADRGESIFDGAETLLASHFRSLVEKVQLYLKNESLIRNIELINPHELRITWVDGFVTSHKLKELQQKCPCAACHETSPEDHGDVTAKEVTQVGRYALRIQFSKGCSNGLYSLDALKEGALV